MPPVVSKVAAGTCTAVMALPVELVWLDGAAADRLSTFQVRLIDPLPPAAAVPPAAPPLRL